MTINFNTEPYFDDFDSDKKFYKVLFKPGYAVQARELNQIQSIINKQIETFGKHVFKEGSMVIPGNASIDTDAFYVKLQSTSGIDVTTLIGKTVTSTKGLTALVLFATVAENNDPPTLFVKYTNSGSNNVKTFGNNETLTYNSTTLVTSLTGASGNASLASIETGFYFIKNAFIQVQSQTIVLDKYTNTPSYKIGLQAVESIVTSNDDDSLNDNAYGTPNYFAPGADRYSISLVLTKIDLTNTDSVSDFIQIIEVENGKINKLVTSADYSILEKTLARRTYDESGDYTVKNFAIDVREYRNNNRGQWLANTNYLSDDIVLNGGNYYRARRDGTSNSTAPVHVEGSTTTAQTGVIWTYESNPIFNRGVYDAVTTDSIATQNTNKAKYAIGLEPGKAYVKGYEIEKISTEYLPISKPRTTQFYNNVDIVSPIGNYVIVTNINSLPNVSLFPEVSLYNKFTTAVGTSSGTKIGTARVRFIEFNGDTALATSSTKYKLSLFNIKLNSGYSFESDVKQFYIAGGSTATTFTADVSEELVSLIGNISGTSGSTTLTDASGRSTFLTDLKIGDFIKVGSSRYEVTLINSNSSLTVTQAPSTTFTGAAISRYVTSIKETNNDVAIFLSPYSNVTTIRDPLGVNDTSYSAIAYISKSTTTGTTVTIPLSDIPNATSFASVNNLTNYLVLNNTTGSIVNASFSIVNNNSLVVDGLAQNTNYVVLVTVNKNGSGEKTKTLSTATKILTSENDVKASTIILDKADGLRLLAVKMAPTITFGNTPTNDQYTLDISDRYSFDDGQKAAFYDLASVTLNASAATPSNPIKIVYEYFDHSGAGDFFTVNSYLSTISYDEIPFFGTIPLADTFDFRPRISNVGTTMCPKRDASIKADLQSYIGRKDIIALDLTGSFFSVTGTPDINANLPSTPSTGMMLYNLDLYPYGYSTKSVIVNSIDNKRYTMRDIGKLEKRIDNVEYYTSLSLLEQQTQSFEIRDNTTGLNRFKNGFIVDNFSGHTVGDVGSQDYICSIDMENQELRPFYYMDNVNLIEKNSTNTARSNSNYRVTGDLVTLPYTEVEMVSQLNASRTENINPFAIFTFIGSMNLMPSSDEWFETQRLPDVVTNVEGNFTAISAIAERSGVIGTVWNAWQTQWTGTPVIGATQTITQKDLSKEAIDARFGYKKGRNNSSLRSITFQTEATTIGQSRTGVRTYIAERIDREVTEDRVVSKAIIPYIRSRNLLFVVRGLKPNTTFTPFFDLTNISSYVTPATVLTLTSSVTGFDSSSKAGGNSTEKARLINNNPESALDQGDIIYVSKRGTTTYTKDNSPVTGVLGLSVPGISSAATKLHVVNTIGAFQAGDTITGSISGITATINNVTSKSLGSSLLSSERGDVIGLFNIPNTDQIRFRTGVREFKLSDDVNDGVNRTSYVKKQYRAEGILETKQATITATRNAEVRQEAVTGTQTVVQQSDRIISDTGWYDPLAQSFLVDSDGGAFVTSVDIYFASKDNVMPVRMQIREMVNGYPGKAILPFSEIALDPTKVNLGSTTVTTSTGDTYPAPVATRFTFDSPVYLNNSTEYCIVLLSDSNNYRCWISQLGDTSVVNDSVISEQPYAGVLFKSQNASTWTADQSQDLMFRINKAEFATNVLGQIDFVNTNIPTYDLKPNPFYTITGKNYVRVYHENHGFFTNSNPQKVTISGVTSPVAGIPITELNKEHTILSADLDSYVVQVTTNATFTGNFGNSGIKATENIQYTTIQPIIQQQLFPNTQLTHSITTTSGKSIHGTETPFIISSQFAVSANENNKLNTIQLVANQRTEELFNGNNKSLVLTSRMSTNNKNISPVIDIARLSAILVQDRINSPTEANTNYDNIDLRSVVSNSLISISGNRISTSDTATKNAFLTITIGKYIKLVSSTNTGKYLVTNIASDGSYIDVATTLITTNVGTPVSVSVSEHYVDEIAPIGSSSTSKYVSKKINLDKPASYLKIRLAADVMQAADLSVYYKVGNINTDFSKLAYTEANSTSTLIKSNDGQFIDVDYDVTTPSNFTAVQIKLVMNSTSTSNIVRIKDLVIIACV